MKNKLWSYAVGLALSAAWAGQPAGNPDFSGTWELSAARSVNLGMMAAMKVTLVLSQTATQLTIRETSVFQDKPSERTVHYDLTGKPVDNEGPMGGRNETRARWSDGRLVVTWTSEGAVAGTRVVRTETRSLAADGRTMSVESVRGTGKPVVMVFERRK
jgi:hypothetical protein